MLSIVGRGRGVGDRLDLVDVLGVSVVDLLADLLEQGELNSLAGGSSQLCDALLSQLDVVPDFGDGDVFLLGEALARDSDQANGLMDALLDGLGEGNLDVLDVLSDDGHVVANLLGNLLAVVVAVPVVSVAVVRLADGDHLGVALLGEGNGDGLGGDGNRVLAVGVDADLVVNNLNTLTAHGAGHRVALLGTMISLVGTSMVSQTISKAGVQTSADSTTSTTLQSCLGHGRCGGQGRAQQRGEQQHDGQRDGPRGRHGDHGH